jgi:hypothetical protein
VTNLFSRLKYILNKPQFDSTKYWESRYKKGGTSGSGSYGNLAHFKARVINDFVFKNDINSVIEFGCGDGNQLSLSNYPQYTGLDVSPSVLRTCIERFASDNTKSFFLYDGNYFVNRGVFRYDLSLSLDVIYHLVEQDVYENYLHHLFGSSEKYVIVYSSNVFIPQAHSQSHELHRQFTVDVERLFAGTWTLYDITKNEFQPSEWGDENGSAADFYFFRRKKG